MCPKLGLCSLGGTCGGLSFQCHLMTARRKREHAWAAPSEVQAPRRTCVTRVDVEPAARGQPLFFWGGGQLKCAASLIWTFQHHHHLTCLLYGLGFVTDKQALPRSVPATPWCCAMFCDSRYPHPNHQSSSHTLVCDCAPMSLSAGSHIAGTCSFPACRVGPFQPSFDTHPVIFGCSQQSQSVPLPPQRNTAPVNRHP